MRVFTGSGSAGSAAGLYSAFRGASVIVGPHGAGFTGVAFARDGAAVIEVGEGCCYEHIAGVLRLRHTRLLPQLSRESVTLVIEPTLLVRACEAALRP